MVLNNLDYHPEPKNNNQGAVQRRCCNRPLRPPTPVRIFGSRWPIYGRVCFLQLRQKVLISPVFLFQALEECLYCRR
jgi:hypothetical protein